MFVKEHMIMRGTRRALQTGVRAEIKVVLERTDDITVDHGTSQDVSVLVTKLVVFGSETSVMALVHDDERDSCVGAEVLQGGLDTRDFTERINASNKNNRAYR